MLFFFFQAEDGIRDWSVTGVQTCALPILDTASAIESSIDADVLPRPDEAASLSYIEADEATLANGAVAPDTLQFWESEHTRPDFQQGGGRSEERRVGKERSERAAARQ